MSGLIGIAVFSGTGNTRLVADLLAASLRSRGAPVQVLAIEDLLMSRGRWDTSPYVRIGIGWPVHAWDAPRIVYDLVRRLPDGRGKPAFTFRSAGDPFLNGGPPQPLRHELLQRGYAVRREDLFIMPANVLLPYPPAVMRQLYLKAQRRAEAVADALLQDVPGLDQGPPWHRTLARPIAAAQKLGAHLAGRLWRTTDACKLCGRCVSRCPTGNIQRDLARVTFGWHCLLCLRCVYGCPRQAIRPALFSHWLVLRHGYDPSPMLDASLDEAEPLLPSHRGWRGRLYRYLASPDP